MTYKKVKLKNYSIKAKSVLWKLEKSLLYYLPRKIAHQWYYRRRTGKKLDLINPKDFNEKLQWLIINFYGEKEAKYADKLLVRDYVKSKGFGHILPKLYGAYNKPEEIDYCQFPEKFVLKTNHASGEEFYLICDNKKQIDKDRISQKFNRALKKNFAKVSLEYHYSYIKRKVICEEYIESNSDDGLLDYKVFCFHGKPEYILVISNRGNEHLERMYYDVNWNPVNLLKKQYQSNMKIERPINLKEMLYIAKELSKPFVFARIDFYNVNGKIYFGEITLTPATGINETYTKQGLEVLGNRLNISDLINDK